MLKPGMILCDRYEIIDVVGAGGMSIVYKAKDHRLNRNVAIKILKPEFSNNKNFVSKFKDEAQASASLTHPNIVNIIDVINDEGVYFIVMELVDGITLKEYIQQKGRLDMETTINIAMQIASGLEAAHENHIIHRDIKPQNIIIAKNGNIKVTDFGIARAATSNTLTSGAMGSVHYISPEQARGGYSDERSDIYSLGITMYEMVTGRVPFEGDSNVSVALMHIQNNLIPPREYYPDIYSSLEKVILKATQKKPERRYLTASALIADLKRVQNNPNIDIVVASSAVTNSPTQEWTKEDLQAIREGAGITTGLNAGASNINSGANNMNSGVNNAYRGGMSAASALNMFNDNPPLQNEMGELMPNNSMVSASSVDNSRINAILNEDPWEDMEEEETPKPAKRGNLKKVQDEEPEMDYDDDDSEIDPGLRKAVIIAGVATAVIIVVVLIVVLGNMTGFFKAAKKDKATTTSTENTEEQVVQVQMIDLTNPPFSEESAIKELKNLGFEDANIKIEYGESEDTSIPEGYVYDQSVKKNEIVGLDEVITIYVVAPAELVEVPDVVNYEDGQAVTILQEAGFVVRHGFEANEEIEKDKVIRTEPEKGTMLKKGAEIIIYVSNGSEKKEVKVPNLTGLTETEARVSLTDEKLVTGSVTHQYDENVPEGQVISQNPAKNETVEEGDSVSFVISDGPEPKPTTYTANVSGTVSCVDPNLDGQAVTIQVQFNGETISSSDETVLSGQAYNISGKKTGLAEQNGTATVVIIDAAGNNVTSSFNPSTSISYISEEQ